MRILAALLPPLLLAAAADGSLERTCLRDGWQRADLRVAGLDRRVLWKAPRGAWRNGGILVLHGGGQAEHKARAPPHR